MMLCKVKKVFGTKNVSNVSKSLYSPHSSYHILKKRCIVFEEIWQRIPDFPDYSVSSLGRVCNNETDRIMSTSKTNFGHAKITIYDVQGCRRTMSVALLVAQAFVEPPDERSDNVILLDGDFENLHVSNLELRPRWFAWKYARQLRTKQPDHYYDPVYNVDLERFYKTVVECGMTHGLLFPDIWRSGNSISMGSRVYPYNWKFVLVDK